MLGGKSELHRAECWLTASGGDPKESATENIPPVQSFVGISPISFGDRKRGAGDVEKVE